MACFDTTFLIDLLREERRGKPGEAARLLEKLLSEDETCCTTLFTIGELYAGLSTARDFEKEKQQLDQLTRKMDVLPFFLSTAQMFGILYGVLRGRGMEIGIIDALIACVALENGETLITRNTEHFTRIPGLTVRTY